MKERNDHFMKTEMLVGQQATLEEPVDAFTVNIDKEVELIADDVLREIQRWNSRICRLTFVLVILYSDPYKGWTSGASTLSGLTLMGL